MSYLRGVRGFIPGAAFVACAVLAMGCGSDESNDQAPASTNGAATKEKVKIKLGSTPTAAIATVQLAEDQGFFEEEGLDVDMVSNESSAATMASAASGEVDIGQQTVFGVTLARANGLPIKIIAPLVAQPAPKGLTSPDDTNAVVVARDSPIRTPKDLEGKTIAVNQARGLLELATRETARLNGVDDSKLKFRVLPLPEALQAVEQGKVDAAATVEPFLTNGRQRGVRTVMNIYPLDSSKHPEWLTGVWFTTDSYLEKNRDAVERFRRAMLKANKYANEHPDETRKAIVKIADLPPEQAEKITLFNWPSELDEEGVEIAAKQNEEYGYTDKKVEMSDLIAPMTK